MNAITDVMLANSSRFWLSAILLAVCAYGALLYAETYAGFGDGGLASAPFPNPVRAETALAAADPAGHDAVLQRKAALAGLAARPADLSPWLRLAHADALARHGASSPTGLDALATSYRIGVYASGLAPWRLNFALRHWAALAPATRQAATREIAIILTDPPRLYTLRKLNRALPPGEGKVAAYFLGVL